jgi:AbrB family looped-hinge helix DNA binding protein
MARTVETTRLSPRGQIVLPKSIRDDREWVAGIEFAIEEAKDGILLRPLRPFPRTELKDVAAASRIAEGERP